MWEFSLEFRADLAQQTWECLGGILSPLLLVKETRLIYLDDQGLVVQLKLQVHE